MNRYAFGLLVSAAALTGCASMGNMLGHGTEHFYEGEPRPMTEVSVIESNGEYGWGMGSGVSLIAIDGKKLPTLAQSKQALLPGKHTVEYECDLTQNVMNGKRAGRATTTIELEKGVHYRLVGNLYALPKDKWYYSEDTFMGTTNRKLESNACDLKVVKFKALTNEG